MLSRLVALLTFFLGTTATETSLADGLFDTLTSHCGKAFQGTVVRGPDDDPWRKAKLIMHVRDCSTTTIRVPLHYDDDRSRIWIVTKTENGMRLKHDHRHDDGSADETTMYGGHTAEGDGDGGDDSVAFLVDEESIRLFRSTGSTRSTDNVWSMAVKDNVFYYGLVRPELDFMVAFDLTKPVPIPPPSWDKIH